MRDGEDSYIVVLMKEQYSANEKSCFMQQIRGLEA